MKSVLISIKPFYVFLIIAKYMGWNIEQHKTMEVRKTCPKSDWNKIAKIYCTKDKKSFSKIPKEYQPFMKKHLGKVIGEFLCNEIKCFGIPYPAFQSELDKRILEESCLTYYQLHRYAYHDALYGWHISDLKIYDEPKELSEFIKPGYEEMETLEDTLCNYCSQTEYGIHKSGTSPISGGWFCEGRWCESSYKKYLEKEFSLKRPPQSWCYVEEII